MFERLEQLEKKYEELTQALASPDIVNDSARYQKTAKAHSELVPVVEKFREFKDLKRGIAESKAMIAGEDDAEMRAYAQQELTQLEERVGRVEEELKVLLIPKDPNGTLARVLSWIPFYTPFTMMNRAAADPPLVDLIGTLILLLATTCAALRRRKSRSAV